MVIFTEKMIPRIISDSIEKKMFKGKAILLFGPRQSGKTTLVRDIIQKINLEILFLNGDEFDIRDLLNKISIVKLKALIGNKKIVFIDEAQKINEIGTVIKLIVDNIKNVQVIATGSSSFELTNKLNEPLTGRKYEYILLPLSFQEMVNYAGLLDEQRLLEHRLIYGYYPEVVAKQEEDKKLIKLIANSYLYKDILSLESVRNSYLIEKLTKAIALQLGSEVSINELSRLIGANYSTVEKYLDLLEKAFVIFKLSSLSRNVRNEIRKTKKYYFYDNGIRNAILGNFNNIKSRIDLGALWENFIISERIKFNLYNEIDVSYYFWRTKQQQEIDYIEEKNGEFNAYEIKWNPKAIIKIPMTFLKNYRVSKMELINSYNYPNFLLK